MIRYYLGEPVEVLSRPFLRAAWVIARFPEAKSEKARAKRWHMWSDQLHATPWDE